MKFVVLLFAACGHVSAQTTDSAVPPVETKAISAELDPTLTNDDTPAFVVAALIDLAIVVVYFILFCLLRPHFGWLYNPRNLSESKVEGASPPLPRGLISWILPVLRLSNEELFRTTGLDALMFVRFFKLGIEIFTVATFLGIILLIVNVTGGNNAGGIGVISLANVPTNDNRLWAHLIVDFALTLAIFWLLKRHYVVYMKYRILFLHGEGMGADNLRSRSLAVYNIPPETRSQNALFEFFRKIFGDRVESVAVTCNVSDIEKEIKKRDAALMKLEHAVVVSTEGKPAQHREKCCGPKVDSVEQYTKQADEANQKVLAAQTKAMEGKKYPIGFATFVSERDAHSIVNSKLSAFKSFELRLAPEPRDVIWDNCKNGSHMRTLRYFIAKAMVVALILFWTIPVAFVASLTTMSNLTKWLPFLSPILDMSPALQGLIQGFLPTLALTLFMIILPKLLVAIGIFEGNLAMSWVQMSVFKNFTLFSIFDIFLATTLAGSLLGVLQDGLDSPLSLVSLLGQSLPGFSTFFAAYVLLKAAGLASGLCNVPGLVIGFVRKKFAKTSRERALIENPGPPAYGVEYSQHNLVLIIGLSYILIAPLVAFCALAFFLLGYLVCKYEVAYVNIAVYESGGAFWPLLHNRILAGLLVGQLTMIALFGLKKAPIVAGISVVPVIFTLLYYCYMNKKYRPRAANLPLEETRIMPLEDPRPVSVYQPAPLLDGGYVTNVYFPKRTTAFNPEDVSPLLEAEPNAAPGTKQRPEGINLDVLPSSQLQPSKDLVAPNYTIGAGAVPPRSRRDPDPAIFTSLRSA